MENMENCGEHGKRWKTLENMKNITIWTFLKVIFLIILRRYFNSSIQIFVFQKIVLHTNKMLILIYHNLGKIIKNIIFINVQKQKKLLCQPWTIYSSSDVFDIDICFRKHVENGGKHVENT